MAQKKGYFQVKNKFYLEGAFSFANFTLFNGIFLVGFALALGANHFQMGILLAIPLFANLIQLISAFILEATGTKKLTALISLFLGRSIWIIIILIAFGVVGKNHPLFTLAAVLVVSSIFISIGNLSLLSWMKDVVPLRKLARFLGKRNIYSSAGGFVVYLLCSYIIDKYYGVEIFGSIFTFAVIIGILGLFFLLEIPEKKQKIIAVSPKRLWTRLLVPFRDKNFRPLLFFGLFWGFAINISAPFFLVFMVDDLSLSFFIVSLFLLMDAVARIYGLSVWRKIGDKFGAKPLLTISATVTSMVPLALAFITKSNFLLIPLIFIVSAISYAAVDIAVSQVLFKSAPRTYDAYYLSAFTSLTGLMSALGPIIGGLLALLIRSHTINLLSPLKYVFIISFILRTSCIPLVAKIYEPRAKEVGDIIERMKTLRFFSFFVNIYSFAHYTSKIVLVPQKQFFLLQRKTLKRTRRDLNILFRLLSKINSVLSRSKLSARNGKEIKGLKNDLTKRVEKLDYEEGLQKIPKKVLSEMNSLKTNLEKPSKKEILSMKESVEKVQEKLKNFEK
jgi:MFS family permease